MGGANAELSGPMRGAMSNTAETRAIVQRFWDSMNSGDEAIVRDFMQRNFAADIEWHVMGSGVPGAGAISGLERVLEVISGVRTLFEPGHPQGVVHRMLVDGGSAAAQTEVTGQMRDGRTYRNRYAFFFEVSGGKIRRLYEYFDTFYVHELLKQP